MCRNCGALIGAGESACAMCGAPLGGSVEDGATTSRRQPRHDVETMRFAHAILARPAIFTIIFLIANVFVFLLMYQLGHGNVEDLELLRVFGAKYNSLINAPYHQWWRLVTPIFIHIGWLHLLVNMYSLFIIGPYVERLYGSAKFVFFWVATGVAGVAASYLASSSGIHTGPLAHFLFRGGDGPSAGASGALFGLIGVLFVFGIKFRHELPEGFKRAFGTGMLPTILINLFIGFEITAIDNAAHLGGFAAGALLALFIGYKRPGERGSVAIFWHVLQVAALALLVVSFGEVARHFRDVPPPAFVNANPIPPKGIVLSNGNVIFYLGAVNEGHAAISTAINKGNVENVDRALADLDHVPHLDAQADKLRDDLKELIVRARDYAPINRKERQTPREEAQGKQLIADLDAWDVRFKQWIESEGKNYGLNVPAPSPSTTQDKHPSKNTK